MDDDERQRIALWRFGVLGPLVSARLEHGDRRAWFRAAAERVHEHPGGRLCRLSARTIEGWYLAYRQGGLAALRPQTRSDCGKSRVIRPEVADLLLRAKRERPRRSIRRLIRLLERAEVVRVGELSRSSVHRLLASHELSGRPLRGAAAERRSFILEHAGDLWIGDALHFSPVVAPDGRLGKAILFSELDCATRYVIESRFTLARGERPEDHEHGLKTALRKGGLPHRRAQLWADIKKALVHLVDERHQSPIVVIDQAQHLGDKFLVDLSGFLNFAFDSRDLLTLWLTGLPALRRTLSLQQHAPLAMRIATQVHFEPITGECPGRC